MSYQVIDEAVVRLGLEDDLTGPMARAVAEARAEIEALGREKANIKVDADTAKAKAKLEELRAEVRSLKDAEDAASKARLSAAKMEANAAEKELKQLQQKAQITKLINRDVQRQLSEESKGQQQLVRDIQAANRVKRESQKIAADAAKQAERDAAAEAKRNADRLKQEEQINRAHAAALKEDEQRTRQLASMQDQAARMDAQRTAQQMRASAERVAAWKNEASLQRQNIKAQEDLNSAVQDFKRAKTDSERVKFGINVTEAQAKLMALREEIKLLGKDPVTIKIKTDTNSFKNTLKQGAMRFVGLESDPRQIRDISREAGNIANKLNSAKVNIGPLTMSVKTLLVALGTLGPMITGLVGAAGSLISVLGAGIGGAAGVGAAALTGFGMAALGILSNVKPFITSLQQAHMFTQKLNLALDKYGASSKQGKLAQQQFNHEIKSLPPLTQATVVGFQDLRQKWLGLTSDVAKHDIGRIVKAGFTAARNDMGFFAADTNKAFDSLASGFEKFTHMLSSGAGKASLSNIFANFDRALPAMNDGFVRLSSVLLRVLSNFSNFFPLLSRGFDNWAKGIQQASGRSHGFAHGVSEMVMAMQELGHFTESAGRFLITFFKAGLGPGVGLVHDMTDGLNHLNDSMSTTSGQSRLQSFFQRSVNITKELWAALLPLVSAFVQFSQAMSPVASIGLQIVSIMAKVASSIVGFKPLQWVGGLLLAVGIAGRLTAALREAGMGVFALGKKFFDMYKLMRAGGGLADSFKGAFGIGGSQASAITEAMQAGGVSAGEEIAAAMVAAGEEVAAMQAAGGALRGAENAGQGVLFGAEAGVASGATTEIGTIAPAAAEGEAAIGGLGAAMVAAAPEIAAVAAVGVGLAAAFALMTDSTTNAERAQHALNQVTRDYRGISKDVRTAGVLPQIRATGASAEANLPADRSSVNSLQREYNKLVERGTADNAQGRAVLGQLNQAINAYQGDLKQTNDTVRAAHGEHEKLLGDMEKKVPDAVTNAKKAWDAYRAANKKVNDIMSEGRAAQAGLPAALKDRAGALDAARGAQEKLNAAQDKATQLQEKLIADNVNAKRAQLGMPLIMDQQAVAVGRLTKQIIQLGTAQQQTKAMNFLIHVPNPADLSKISNMVNHLLPSNKTSAISILANSKTAEQAIARLNSLTIKDKTMRLNVDAGDAIAKLARIEGIHFTPKEMRIIHSGDVQAIQKIAQVKGLVIPDKVFKLITSAEAALAQGNQVKAQHIEDKIFSIIAHADQAQSAIGNIISSIAAIPKNTNILVNTTHTNTTVNRTINSGGGTGGQGQHVKGPGGATGGPAHGVYMRAMNIAGSRGVRNHRGGKFGEPTFLVGEEKRPEWIIASNPAYRQANIGYLRDAANTFGMQIIPAATGHSHRSAGSATKGYGLIHKRRRNFNTAPAAQIPAWDRIGGIGVDDLTSQVSDWQSALGKDQSLVNSWKGKVNTLNSSINRLLHEKRKPGSAAASALATDRSNLGVANKNLSIAQGNVRTDKKQLGSWKGALRDANAQIQDFADLENQIAAVQAFVNTAATDPNGIATGINPKTQKYETWTWSQWNQLLASLQHDHTQRLEKAFESFKTKKLKKASGSQLPHYLSLLEAAIGTSIADETATQDASAPNAGTPNQVTINGVTYTNPEDMTAWLTDVEKQETNLEQLTANLTDAQIREALNPGDANNYAAQQTAAQALVDFWTSEYGKSQVWTNPVTNSKDYGLVNAVGQALLGSIQTSQSFGNISSAQQSQLTSAALGSLYSTYGGNAANVILGSGAQGAAVAASSLGSAMAARVSGGGVPVASSAAPSAAGNTVHVTNHFSHPPEDPHIWAKNIQWELQA